MSVIRGNENIGFMVAPADINEEVSQNVRLILSSKQFEIPLARGMGINPDIDGKPFSIAETLMAQSISDAIEKYEPRAEIISIDFAADNNTGRLIPIVEVRAVE